MEIFDLVCELGRDNGIVLDVLSLVLVKVILLFRGF